MKFDINPLADFEDDFLRIKNLPGQFMPEIWHRELKEVLVGHWFFGLIPIYDYVYTDWVKQENT